MLIDDFRGFSQSIQANASIIVITVVVLDLSRCQF
jgi:hypothetical protein